MPLRLHVLFDIDLPNQYIVLVNPNQKHLQNRLPPIIDTLNTFADNSS